MPAEENTKTWKIIFNELFDQSVYVISDSVEVLRQAIADGATVVQLRDKTGDTATIRKKALEVLSDRKNRLFIFILNDDPELAVGVHADGVHIGQDFSIAEARKLVGAKMILGKSTHSLAQGLEAEKEGADYISVGPVFRTPTKPGRPAVGVDYVRQAAERIALPFVAIGGIDLRNVDEVLDAGAKTIGVVRAAKDVPAFFNKLRSRQCT